MTQVVQDSREYSVRVEEAMVPWLEWTFLGLPVWAWILIAVGGVVVAGVAYEAERRRRLEMLMMMK